MSDFLFWFFVMIFFFTIDYLFFKKFKFSNFFNENVLNYSNLKFYSLIILYSAGFSLSMITLDFVLKKILI